MGNSNEFTKRMEELYVDDIQFDEQGNIIYDELEQRERNSERWQGIEKRYGINFGDVVNIDGLARVQGLSVSEGCKDSDGLLHDHVDIKFWGGTELEDFDCLELGMTAKEFLKDIKIQPREKEKKLSLKEKINKVLKTANTIKTKVQTLKKGGAAERLANRRTNVKDVGITR